MTASSLLDSIRDVLAGEPARAIGYGAGVIIYIAARVSGSIDDLSLEDSLLLTAGYVATFGSIIETIRKFVYSTNTVVVIAADAAATGDPTFPQPPADELT